ncbi:hypothetical protein NSK_004512 [Nannochloropsis salina CCMP1776]|uniref:Essential protein Yae1 N-terminal domain-containing protein n=1 Tax=Nannochloropsis salina CCMP1776 TaxID=1027361 RepID=A0A4D9D2G3_9STRA|nr:hypothetical protein NSK_004512 [Nannochloropsis salina CCMP1776]|eukprot:TFJ84527.1 hypothetical protein NSK_004512 [Nannochloropsis salina CCMP1776]
MTNAEEARHTSSLDLDVVVHLDETWYQEGYQEGGEAGRRRGRREGRAVGKAKGFEIGCELGFYKACSQIWLFVIKDSNTGEGEKVRSKEFDEIAAAKAIMDTTAAHRAIRTLEGIIKIVQDFPRQNVADVDMAAHVQRLRAKFRAVTSMLGISVKFPLHMSGRISDGETAGGVGALSF